MSRSLMANLRKMGMEQHAQLLIDKNIRDLEDLIDMPPLSMVAIFHDDCTALSKFERAHKAMAANWIVGETENPAAEPSAWKIKEEYPLGFADPEAFTDNPHQPQDKSETQFSFSVKVEPEQENQLDTGNSASNSRKRAASESVASDEEPPRKLADVDDTDSNIIKEYLQQTLPGIMLLAIGKKRRLGQADRVKLAEVIIYAEFGNDCEKTISKARFKVLADAVPRLFPSEKATSYYVPRVPAYGVKPAVQPKGVLFDKYHNLLKVLRREGLRSSCRSSTQDEDDDADSPLLEDLGHASADLEYLTRNSLTNRAVTVDKWKNTVRPRYALLNTVDQNCRARVGLDKVQAYYSTYPCLEQPWGIDLLENDFEELFGSKSFNFLENWRSISKTLKKVMKKYISDENLNEVGETVKILQCIPLSLKQPAVPCGAKLQKGEARSVWKPSQKESTYAFLQHAETTDILTQRIREMKKQCDSMKHCLQPFPAVVGSDLNHITDSFVIIGDRWYAKESPLAAFNACFKAVHALHCKYPVQASYAWLCVQKALYRLNTDCDPTIPMVESFVDRFLDYYEP